MMIDQTNIPDPNFDLLRRALLCEGELERVPLLELKADSEIITEVMGVKKGTPSDETEMKRWTEIEITFWRNLGYDAVRVRSGMQLPRHLIAAEDTATLQRSQRDWQSVHDGPIGNWDDFERFAWPHPADADFSQIEYASTILPEGMKLLVSPYGMLEPLMWLMGYVPFSMALYDNPDLIVALVEQITNLYVPIIESLIDMECVGGVFIPDDMGHKTGTLIAPEHLRQYVFPYHKRMAEIVHDHDKVFILHACGNLEKIMQDLIDDVRIDAKHSFEDIIMPIESVKERYGGRVGIVGGIDIDLMSRGSQEDVRRRVTRVLDHCMPGGGYVLGTGNSVTNYIPVTNFLAMVEEGHRWSLTR